MMKRFHYTKEFASDMELFEELIKHDPKIDPLVAKNKNHSQRFSAAMRDLILFYNRKRGGLVDGKTHKA